MRLTIIVKLLSLKIKNGWIDKNFTELLELLKEMFLKKISYLIVTMKQKRYYVRWV